VDAFGDRRASIVDRVWSLIERDLVGFDGWYSERLMTELADAVAAKVLAGQRNTAALTDAYLARVTSILAGSLVSPVGVGSDMAQSLRIGQADLGTVYLRLGAEFRYQRSLGVAEDAARSLVSTRASVMADTDLSLAHRAQADRFMRRRSVERFRRVLRSEKPCGLCAAASDRIYTRGDLMPIHGRCRCGVMPVTVSTDPGSTLSNDDLAAIYKAAGGTSAAKLKRVTAHQHGELGPVLSVKGQHFRGPAAVAAA
jgi:hypothetical protein